MSASRLQHISLILQVPISYFFEDVPGPSKQDDKNAATSLSWLLHFLATSEGLSLARAFTRLPNAKVRRNVVALVKEIAARQ
jgi:hypothetical protein